MVETVFIAVLTVCVVITIPWMMKRDYEKRMLSALKAEVIHNMALLGGYTATPTGDSEDGISTLPVLKDDVFKRIQQADFHSRGLSDEDRDALEKVFAVFSGHMMDISYRDRMKLCAENLKVLEGVEAGLADYLKGSGVR